jgi:hypothetical protein
MSTYDVTDELLVEEDGPIRVIPLNRPEHLNATNHGLHRGLAGLFPQIDADEDVDLHLQTSDCGDPGLRSRGGGSVLHVPRTAVKPRSAPLPAHRRE